MTIVSDSRIEFTSPSFDTDCITLNSSDHKEEINLTALEYMHPQSAGVIWHLLSSHLDIILTLPLTTYLELSHNEME